MYIPSDRYTASDKRYDGTMKYRRCGKSGIVLPMISLGLWHNFGDITPKQTQQALLFKAFDLGITHFDLANNYGPPYGAAETNFGNIFSRDLKHYRDELIISSKAGYDMWTGPYGDHGSRKYLMASIDQSLKRMHLDYVDIFYHHRPDPDTPIEETMGALADIVHQGKALYVGISNYGPQEAKIAFETLEAMGVHCLITQPNYSLLDRWIENGLTDVLREKGVGSIVFKPLEQGMLSGKYLKGVPSDSRLAKDPRYLHADDITDSALHKISALAEIAAERGQTLAQFSLAWILRDEVVTSALIGASRPEQLVENVAAINNISFTEDELRRIDEITK